MSVQRDCIVADIGGTNGRFAVASLTSQSGLPELSHRQSFACADFPDLIAMLAAYLGETPKSARSAARLAIAGPTAPRFGRFINLNWTVDAAEIERKLGVRHVRLLNDFEALASAVPSLGPAELLTVKAGQAEAGRPLSVMGPGTGFGAALVLPGEGGTRVIPTEPGHMGVSPHAPVEFEFCRHLVETIGHAPVEAAISGPGLERIHAFLATRRDGLPLKAAAADIANGALADPDSLYGESVVFMLNLLGGVAGDLALAHGARGGVYLGGGILPKIRPLLARSDFVKRFCSKGPLSEYVYAIPVNLILTEDTALFGAALAA